MVWFQCEDCGEDLKKPKLPNHIRICSSTKFSCIDCGQTFAQESVLSHNQCMTEAEKYGPKGQGKPSNGTPARSNSDAKKKPEVDVNVGLSSRPPWFCSLCNSSATSKQTLLLHADGKKHRAKARAFHASKEPPKEKNEAVSNGKDLAGDLRKADSVCTKGEEPSEQDLSKLKEAENGSRSSEKKRKLVASDEGGISGKTEIGKGSSDLVDGEVIQAKRAKTLQQEDNGKKSKHSQEIKKESTNATGDTRENKHKNIKWKKLITSVLKMNPKGVMKLRKLQKLVYKSLQESGQSGDVDQVKEKLMEKINSSSKFTLDNKLVHLVVRS